MVQMSVADQAKIKALPGNDKCVDCGMKNPQWASVSFGTLFCLECSGIHRSFGVHISFVRSIAMDSWTDPQLSIMRVGGNSACKKYLMDHGVPPSTPIKQKYESPVAQLYKEVLKARSKGLPEPTSLPTPAPRSNNSIRSTGSASSNNGDPNGMERLRGESEQEYVARQMRLREQAKARMQAKFGNKGMGGLGSGSSGMVGIGSDSSYDPSRGGYSDSYGDFPVDSLVSGFSSAMSTVGEWGQSSINKASQYVNDPYLKENVRSTSSSLYNVGMTTGSSLWSNFASTASKIASNIAQPDDDDGLVDFQRKMHAERENRVAVSGTGSSRYSGFGSEDLMNSNMNSIGATKVTQTAEDAQKDLIDFNSWGNNEVDFGFANQPASAPSSSRSNPEVVSMPDPSLANSYKSDTNIVNRASASSKERKIQGTGDDFFSSFGA